MSDGFSADWLRLRQPADDRARDPRLRDKATALGSAPAIVDLACGTGATLRALAPHLPPGQRWRLVDHDAALLARAQDLCADVPCVAAVTPLQADLAAEPEAALVAFAEGERGPDLVTTSAFLDLVSDTWLARVVALLAARRLPFYAALTYDGRAGCTPEHDLDAAVIAAVNRHQRGDKGFGPALGPEAAAQAVQRFQTVGYAVESAASDWLCLEHEAALQRALIDGWAGAAAEIGGIAAPALAEWRDFRLAAIARGASRITVGHRDILARPAP